MIRLLSPGLRLPFASIPTRRPRSWRARAAATRIRQRPTWRGDWTDRSESGRRL